MSDIPDNVDLKFIAVQLSRLNGKMDAMAADFAVMKADVAVLKSDVSVLKADVAILKADVAILKERVDGHDVVLTKLIDAVTEIARVQRKDGDNLKAMRESINVIEKDLSAIKSRIERIERHTGLVNA